MNVVVPGYYLVWYNKNLFTRTAAAVVVPGYYLVWYNYDNKIVLDDES